MEQPRHESIDVEQEKPVDKEEKETQPEVLIPEEKEDASRTQPVQAENLWLSANEWCRTVQEGIRNAEEKAVTREIEVDDDILQEEE